MIYWSNFLKVKFKSYRDHFVQRNQSDKLFQYHNEINIPSYQKYFLFGMPVRSAILFLCALTNVLDKSTLNTQFLGMWLLRRPIFGKGLPSSNFIYIYIIKYKFILLFKIYNRRYHFGKNIKMYLFMINLLSNENFIR